MFGLNALESIFAGCAIFGGAGFGIWLILQLIGVASEVSADVHAGFDLSAASNTDISFKLVSFQGATSFFLMFGLIGLALSRGGTGPFASIAGGLAAGLVALFVIAKIFDFARKLQSSGTLDMNDTVGAQGIVYLTIPAAGAGKVQITTRQRRFLELTAVSEDKSEIKTGERITVLKHISGSTVEVARTSNGQ